MSQTVRQEYKNILAVMDKYREAQQQGNSAILKSVCHKNAIMHGYAGDTLLEGPMENLFAFIDNAGPQKELEARFDVISLEGTIANVHCCLESPSNSYSDSFQLLKIDGKWKIISKIFHQYK